MTSHPPPPQEPDAPARGVLVRASAIGLVVFAAALVAAFYLLARRTRNAMGFGWQSTGPAEIGTVAETPIATSTRGSDAARHARQELRTWRYTTPDRSRAAIPIDVAIRVFVAERNARRAP